MKNIKNVHLIGLGAVGGSFAGRIIEHMPGSLSVIVDNKRVEKYSRDGLTINGRQFVFSFIQPDEIRDAADLVILAVKQHHLNQAIRDIKQSIGPHTIILSLLNGITSEEIVAKEYGTEKLLYSFCVGIDAVKEGMAISYSNIGRIVFGDRSNSKTSPMVRAVKEFFEKVHIPYNIPEDIIREQWWKFMLNVGINQISAILRAPYLPFTVDGEARELMIAASREVVSISQKAGINLNEDDIGNSLKIIKTLAPSGKTSMLQDVEAKRKTEVEIFAGAVMELGKKYGVKTPVNDVLYKMLRAIEQMQ